MRRIARPHKILEKERRRSSNGKKEGKNKVWHQHQRQEDWGQADHNIYNQDYEVGLLVEPPPQLLLVLHHENKATVK